MKLNQYVVVTRLRAPTDMSRTDHSHLHMPQSHPALLISLASSRDQRYSSDHRLVHYLASFPLFLLLRNYSRGTLSTVRLFATPTRLQHVESHVLTVLSNWYPERTVSTKTRCTPQARNAQTYLLSYKLRPKRAVSLFLVPSLVIARYRCWFWSTIEVKAVLLPLAAKTAFHCLTASSTSSAFVMADITAMLSAPAAKIWGIHALIVQSTIKNGNKKYVSQGSRRSDWPNHAHTHISQALHCVQG